MKTLARTWFIAGSPLMLFFLATAAQAKVDAIEITQKQTENQIRRMVEPLLEKYCREECKLLSVQSTVDLAAPDEIAPGFDDMEVSKAARLAPSSGRLKILIDEKVGPVSRSKLVELIQQHLDTFDFPVKIDTQIAKFPQTSGRESRIAQLREKASKQFMGSLNELVAQFCPKHCLVSDHTLKTEVVNSEESQYGNPGEFFVDGDTAIRIKEVGATILMDESLTAEERNNIIEMAKLRTASLRNVTLAGKAMKFPSPILDDVAAGPEGAIIAARKKGGNRSLASQTNDNKSTSSEQKNQELRESRNSDAKTVESRTTSASETQESKKNSITENKVNSQENNQRQERFERIEKIERVENGDAVQAELKKFKDYGVIFACAVLSLLIFIAISGFAGKSGGTSVQRVIQSLAADPVSTSAPSTYRASESPSYSASNDEKLALANRKYEIENLRDELVTLFAQNPKVAKVTFSRILQEEGVETTSKYIDLFGESIVVDMIRDPSMQSDVSELMEFYAKNPDQLSDEDKLELLRSLHNRAIAGKLLVLGNRSSTLFDFLTDMDGSQIMEMLRNENLTVKSIVLTQCDHLKRAVVYSYMEEAERMQLLTELSRIDYLPRSYIFNVANALKRKRRDNPKLNTEALPGSEVLVTLLEKTGVGMQNTVLKSLEVTNPESARTVKSKLVSLDTLRFLRDGQMLEVILSLKHEELLSFLKGCPADIKLAIYSKAPKDLTGELEEELAVMQEFSKEAYQASERRIINRIKIMSNEGLVNLVETNERMFARMATDTSFVDSQPDLSGSVNSGGGSRAA
jgi:flagellar motor switch protein FliG